MTIADRIARFFAVLAVGLLAGLLGPATATPAAAAAPPTVMLHGIAAGQSATGTLAIEAHVSGQNIARVVFTLEGPTPAVHTEKVAPYFFMGDTNGTPKGWNTSGFKNGDYKLTAVASDAAGAKGSATVRFRIANGVTAPQPTATRPPATATPAPAATATPVPVSGPAVAGQLCPASVHDKYVVTGPDGKVYATWHPPVDPASGCIFGHEHGADPRQSKADASLPAFGYAAAQLGMTEPHEGFKVFLVSAGTVNDEGRTSKADYRIVFHMGTSRTGRHTQQFHSLEYDYVARDGSGREAHISGMADTGGHMGSTCDSPRVFGRDFSTIGCNDAYEIWGFKFQIQHPNDPYSDPMHVRAYLSGAVAAFDPITTRDPADPARLVYTQSFRAASSGVDPLSPSARYRGCDREHYGGPNYWANAGKPTVYYTDPYGKVQAGPGPGLIKQEISAVNATSNEQLKYRQSFCVAGLRAPN